MQEKEIEERTLSNAIRALSMDAIQKANSGHPGLPLGMADVATVLFKSFVKFNPEDPDWIDRDRFILSAGHGSMLLYSLLYLLGYEDFSIEEINRFRQLHSKTAGHPEIGHGKGIETTTGPLGQGLANAVGMAIAEEKLRKTFGDDLINHRTYVIAGDGCLMEGISQEAITLAGHLKLSKLIVLFDDNGISIDGKTSLTTSENTLLRFEAAGWQTQSCEGHKANEVHEMLEKAINEKGKPSLIACKTIIGYGSPNKQGTSGVHGSPLGEDEVQLAKQTLGWESEPFVIPKPILKAWRKIGTRHKAVYEKHQQALNASHQKDEIMRRFVNEQLPKRLFEKMASAKEKMFNEKPAIATRKASKNVINIVSECLPELIGGSADLTGSNLTKSDSQLAISPNSFSGNYTYYGAREHAMAAIMNGISLHKGLIPYGGTFLVFSDYARPAMRLSALMNQRVIYVMTHDSIGLGEDGPTHQPIEHLSVLRAIPGMRVFRPCDSAETIECWQLALSEKQHPSVIALSRQAIPFLREVNTSENLSARGGYILSPAKSNNPKYVIIATGSEVAIGRGVKSILQDSGVDSSLVSMPSLGLFQEQPTAYKQRILPEGSRRVIIEAGASLCWGKLLGEKDYFFGVETFGLSAPGSTVYEHFGLTSSQIAKKLN